PDAEAAAVTATLRSIGIVAAGLLALAPRQSTAPASAQAPAPAAQEKTAEQKLVEFLASKGVTLDKANEQIRLSGWINMQKVLVEVLASTPTGKPPEPVLVADCVPGARNAAFIALGYKPGKPVAYGADRYEMPQGEPVWVTVEWKGDGGAVRRVRGEQL